MGLEDRAEQTAVDRLRKVRGPEVFQPGWPAHVAAPQGNLVDGVFLKDFEADFKLAAGHELSARNGEPPKFCAARSSSALLVNTFGPFRHSPSHLKLLGLAGFRRAFFEHKCRTGLRTRSPPHLDFLAESNDAVIGIESKFLEPWGAPRAAVFSPQYRKLFHGSADKPAVAEPPWSALYDDLVAAPDSYTRLDAAQLVKHYLGLKHSYPGKKRILMYLFWEPANARDFAEVAAHRDEVTRLAQRVAGCDTRFVALSYRALWADWERTSDWPGMAAHLARLRERYHFKV